MMGSTRRSIRRLTPVPAPHHDETLGSWIDRLARGQHAARDELVRALCAEHDIARAAWDLDTGAPNEFLAALAARTGVSLSVLRRLTVPGGAPLTVGEDEPYCPVCWRDPAGRYVRRQWRTRWSTACERHSVLLQEMPWPSASDTGEVLAKELRSLTADLPIEMGWMIQSGAELIVELEVAAPNGRKTGRADPQRLERARVLRDLALVAGTRFAGGSLVELSLPIPHGLTNPRRICWCDNAGRPTPPEEVTGPTGPLLLRQQALRVAWLLWLRAYGWLYFEESRDLAMLAIVTWATPDTDVSRAIRARVQRWPTAAQARWEAAYEDKRQLWEAA
jgi:hypothetical protein